MTAPNAGTLAAPKSETTRTMTQAFTLNERQQIDQVIWAAMAEDTVEGDVTSDGLFGYDKFEARAVIKAHQAGVLAGLPVAMRVFEKIDDHFKFTPKKTDGDTVAPGDEILVVSGGCRNLLLAERMALNFLSHLSGVATQTRAFVNAVKGHKARILDTRKTLPGLRLLQKYAVRMGGGDNHRMGLFDMGMIKDNHIMICRDKYKDENFAAWVGRIKKHAKVKVVLEIDSPDQIDDAKASGADVVMLDNFTPDQMREAVQRFAGAPVELEASGNVSLDNVAAVAATGVHRISIGRLTHSVPALDFSMDLSL